MSSVASPGDDDARLYELIRRAIGDRDDAAWSAVVVRLEPQVRAWVRAAPGYRSTGADDGLVNDAFARFAYAMRPERLPQFSSLAALLRYLKACAASAVLDQVRAARRQEHRSLDRLRAQPGFAEPRAADDTEQEVQVTLATDGLLSAVDRVLPDPLDRLVLFLSEVEDMSPSAICARYRQLFPSVRDIYLRKERVKYRLRRWAQAVVRAAESAVPSAGARRMTTD